MSDETKPCPLCAETIKAQAVVCRFCKSDLRTDAPVAAPTPVKSGTFPTILIVVIVIVVCIIPFVAIIAAIAIPSLLQSQHASNERNASTSLKTLASAQADFRANDRDGNGVNDFWTGDIAGLYCIVNPSDASSDPIRLIELSVAGADSQPFDTPQGPYSATNDSYTPQSAKAGYWYWALTTDRSVYPPVHYGTDTGGKPAVEGAHYNVSRFGFIAYPDSLSAGKSAFFLNEGNTLYRRHLGHSIRPSVAIPPGPMTDPIFTSWPEDRQLKMHWSKLD